MCHARLREATREECKGAAERARGKERERGKNWTKIEQKCGIKPASRALYLYKQPGPCSAGQSCTSYCEYLPQLNTANGYCVPRPRLHCSSAALSHYLSYLGHSFSLLMRCMLLSVLYPYICLSQLAIRSGDA